MYIYSYAKESSVTMTPKELGEFLSIEQNITLDSQQLETLISEKEMIFSRKENVLTLSGKIVFFFKLLVLVELCIHSLKETKEETYVQVFI